MQAELEAGVKLGHIEAMPEWLHVVELAATPPALAFSSIDMGEAAVIHLALEQNADWVCMDDWKGRRAALAGKPGECDGSGASQDDSRSATRVTGRTAKSTVGDTVGCRSMW